MQAFDFRKEKRKIEEQRFENEDFLDYLNLQTLVEAIDKKETDIVQFKEINRSMKNG